MASMLPDLFHTSMVWTLIVIVAIVVAVVAVVISVLKNRIENF